VFGDRIDPECDLDVTPTLLSKDVIAQIQEADNVVNSVRSKISMLVFLAFGLWFDLGLTFFFFLTLDFV